MDHHRLLHLSVADALRIAWLVPTLPFLLAWLPFPPIRRLVAGFCARGKTNSTSSSSSKKLTLPQRYFLHFYIVGVFLTTVFLLSTWFYAYRKMLPLATEFLSYSTKDSHLTSGSHIQEGTATVEHKYKVWQTVFLLLLLEFQVLRRLHEQVNVFRYSPSARLHITGYITGLCYYIGAPLSLGYPYVVEALNYVSCQMTEFTVKGWERKPNLEFDWLGVLKPLTSLGWCQWIGASIFFWGWLHQRNCHAILGSLRENKGVDEYVIPHGDWFQYVSCPHYFAEIVIYFGILVASGGSDPTIWLLFIFVVSNLVFEASETHRWYHKKFENYPKSRRAIIPFIY